MSHVGHARVFYIHIYTYNPLCKCMYDRVCHMHVGLKDTIVKATVLKYAYSLTNSRYNQRTCMICSTVHMTLFVMRRCNEFTERDKSGTIEINEISRISPMMESDKRIGCAPKLKFHIDVYLHGKLHDGLSSWASYQIRKIADCACAGNAGNVFPTTDFKGNR